MIYPLDQVAQQISKTDQQLIYHLILEQQETNRLLRELIGTKVPQASAIEPEIKEDETKDLKRPELMKYIAKIEKTSLTVGINGIPKKCGNLYGRLFNESNP